MMSGDFAVACERPHWAALLSEPAKEPKIEYKIIVKPGELITADMRSPEARQRLR